MSLPARLILVLLAAGCTKVREATPVPQPAPEATPGKTAGPGSPRFRSAGFGEEPQAVTPPDAAAARRLKQSDIDAVINPAMPRFGSCLTATATGARGEVRLEVAGSGLPKNVSAKADNDQARNCLAAMAESLRFPRFDGDPLVVTVPVAVFPVPTPAAPSPIPVATPAPAAKAPAPPPPPPVGMPTMAPSAIPPVVQPSPTAGPFIKP